MLLVLPPSRGQTPGPDGATPLNLTALSLPELTAPRRRLLDALAGGPDDVTRSPAARSADVFTGVLFAAAALPRLLDSRGSAAGRTREQVLIASPLLGMVRPQDRIPASRLAMGTRTGVGALGPYWRPVLESALAPLAAGRLVVDARSSEFLPLWRPSADATWVRVAVEQQRSDGARRVVSHFAKHWRGILAHHLLTRRGTEPTDLRSLVRATRGLVTSGAILAVEHDGAARAGQPATLTLVVA